MSPVISNEDFLRVCFGAAWSDAHVTGFAEDPSDLESLGLKHYWAGTKWGRWSARDELRGMNAYFVVSTFSDDPVSGRALRRKALFRAAHVIVVDDVGTKVTVEAAAKLPAPSWKLETSPGNFQWGYVLERPETDAGRVNALLDGMVANGLAADGKDPGMKGVTRYVRLPQGRNTKAKYGAGGFICRLVEWHPGRVYTPEQLAAPWGIVLPPPGTMSGRVGRITATEAGDELFGHLDRWGMIGGRSSDGDGYICECPWIDDHTGRADTGTSYWLGGGFLCNHGHCIGVRKRRELVAWADARLREESSGLMGLSAWDFQSGDKALLDDFWRALAAGCVPGRADIERVALVPDRRAVGGLLRAARGVLGTDTAPICRAIERARARPGREARRSLVATERAATRAARGKAVAQPASPAAPAGIELGAALDDAFAAAAEAFAHRREPRVRRGSHVGHGARV